MLPRESRTSGQIVAERDAISDHDVATITKKQIPNDAPGLCYGTNGFNLLVTL